MNIHLKTAWAFFPFLPRHRQLSSIDSDQAAVKKKNNLSFIHISNKRDKFIHQTLNGDLYLYSNDLPRILPECHPQ